MKLRFLISILSVGVLSGCAHKAKHYDRYDTTTIKAKHEEMQDHIHLSALSLHDGIDFHSAEQDARKQAEASHSQEQTTIAEIAPKLEDLRMRVTAELRPEVDDLKQQVAALDKQAKATSSWFIESEKKGEAAQKKFAEAQDNAQEAEKLGAEIGTNYGPQLEKHDAQMTDAANVAEVGWHEADAKALRLEGEMWAHRILGALAVAGLGFVAFLKFTGRLALKVPGI